jgi:hypothetical protein
LLDHRIFVVKKMCPVIVVQCFLHLANLVVTKPYRS